MRALLLGLMALGMTAVMLLSWGSIGSAVMAMGLLSMGSALLYRRFLNREDPDQWNDM